MGHGHLDQAGDGAGISRGFPRRPIPPTVSAEPLPVPAGRGRFPRIRPRKGAFAAESFLNLVAGTAGVNIAVSALGSLGGLILARSLGPSGRGDLAIIIVWPTLIGNCAMVGLPQATCYWIAKRPEDRRALLGTSAAGLLLFGALLGMVGLIGASAISNTPQVVAGLRVMFALSPVI